MLKLGDIAENRSHDLPTCSAPTPPTVSPCACGYSFSI